MNKTFTHDGTVIITDTDLGAISGRNEQEAKAELRRLKGLQGRPEGSPLITHRHSEIQVRSA